VIVLRALVRLVSFVLLALLALAGLAAAVFSIEGGSTGLSIPGLAADLHLPQLRVRVGDFLGQLEAAGPVALMSLVGGLIAIAAGLALLAGALMPRRERLVQLESNEHGTLNARRRPLAQVASALVEPLRGIEKLKVKVRPGRTSGGRLKVRADRAKTAPGQELDGEMSERLAALTEQFKLKAKVRSRVPSGGARVR
jgi:hypothetical protein